MVNLPGSWVEHGSHILRFQRVALWQQLWRDGPEEHSSYTTGGSRHRVGKKEKSDSVHDIDYCFFWDL